MAPGARVVVIARPILWLPHEFSVSRGVLTFPNESRIIARHFQCEKDIDAYLGLGIRRYRHRGATTLTSRKYHDIVACCRTSQPGWRPRIYATTNPGGGGHAWYRSKYVAPFQPRGKTTPRFIPATTGDNAEYRDILDGTRLVDWLPSLPHDPSRPEEVLKVDPDDDGVAGDDAADALRHLVATKPNSLRMFKLVGF